MLPEQEILCLYRVAFLVIFNYDIGSGVSGAVLVGGPAHVSAGVPDGDVLELHPSAVGLHGAGNGVTQALPGDGDWLLAGRLASDQSVVARTHHLPV